MASLARTSRLLNGAKRAFVSSRQFCVSGTVRTNIYNPLEEGPSTDELTHTGQSWDTNDHRRQRFQGRNKLVNRNFAQDLVAQEPVVVVNDRCVMSNSGGALGHPKVYINLDKDEIAVCGYSGRKFIQQKFYDKIKHGPSVSYEEYMRQMTTNDF